MKTQNNTAQEVKELKEALYKLPHNMIKSVKIEIIEQMGWCDATFIAKFYGARKLKKPERTILKMIFESYGIEF
jgi:hypothetical protein